MDPFYAVAAILLTLVTYRFVNRPRRPFPPGPQGLPLIGAALSMPKQKEWLTYTSWSKKYGNIIGLTVFGQKIVIVHTSKMATELLENRGAIYSDRPVVPMLEMMRFNEWNIGLMRYGENLRKSRKLLLQAMQPQNVKKYAHIQQREINQLLMSLILSPELFYKHLKRLPGGITMMIFFGHQVESDDDMYMALHERHIVASTRAASPAAYMVNTLPSLRYLPKWFPGAGFQREAEEGRISSQQAFDLPIQMIKRNMAEGTAVPCFMTSILEDGRNIAAGQAVSATSYTAGTETTTSTLETFFLAMALYPEAQRKAQAEIKEALGGRLPRSEDRGTIRLPFVEALIKETHRWNPPGNIGLPHRLMQEDKIDGYVLPEGTIVLSNIWAILHDETLYPKPFEFLPERYIDHPELEDPRIHVFGYGRRICPGRNLADATIWLSIVSILSVFNISPALDEQGKEIPITVEYTSGIMSRPKEFKCKITPVSKEMADIVMHSLFETPIGT